MADIYVATTGNDSTGDGSSGNPYATPGKVGGVISNGDKIYIKSGTYTLSGATPNVAGGPLDLSGKTNISIGGYQTTINDDGTRPVFSAGAQTSIALITASYGSDFKIVRNLEFDGNDGTGNQGLRIYDATYNYAYRCNFRRFKNYGMLGYASVGYWAEKCGFYGCSGVPACSGMAHLIGCVGVDNSAGTFERVKSTARCISARSFYNFTYIENAVNCVAYGGSRGFYNDSGAINNIVDSVAYGASVWGFQAFIAANPMVLTNCAGGNNTSGNTSNPALNVNFVTLSGDPYNSAAITALSSTSSYEDVLAAFALNNTAGAGAALRAAGLIPYADIGAVQHQDSGGGSVIIVEDE